MSKEEHRFLINQILDEKDFNETELISIINTLLYYRENFAIHDELNNKTLKEEGEKILARFHKRHPLFKEGSTPK